MRIIHTSDWHLGRRFEREPLEDDQRAFLGWLAGLVEARRSTSSSWPATSTTGRCRPRTPSPCSTWGSTGCGPPAPRWCSSPATTTAPGGSASAPGARRSAACTCSPTSAPRRSPGSSPPGANGSPSWPFPSSTPTWRRTPRRADGTPGPATHESVLADALDAGPAALAALDPVPSIAVAHAYVSGAGLSDSERTLAIGGADQVDPAVLAGFDYVALGHLHRPQRIGGSDAMAYSGSPLPYSFSEDHPKSVRLLEVEGGRLTGHHRARPRRTEGRHADGNARGAAHRPGPRTVSRPLGGGPADRRHGADPAHGAPAGPLPPRRRASATTTPGPRARRACGPARPADRGAVGRGRRPRVPRRGP